MTNNSDELYGKARCRRTPDFKKNVSWGGSIAVRAALLALAAQTKAPNP
jgi:hypothetical protein